MPEAVAIRQRKSRSLSHSKYQGRAKVQGHIPAADYVIRFLKKVKNMEERQNLVNQSSESSEATPNLSVQSLRLAHQTNNVTANPIGSRLSEERFEVDVDERKVLIIVTDHSSRDLDIDAFQTSEHFSRPRSFSSCCPTSTSHLSHRVSRSSSQSVEVLDDSSSRSQSDDQGNKKSRKGEKSKCRVSFDSLDELERSSEKGDEVKRKKLKRKFQKKRFVKKTGKKFWRGVRASCKFLWSGLALYAKPFGSEDLDSKVEDSKEWEESKRQDKKRRSCFTYTEYESADQTTTIH